MADGITAADLLAFEQVDELTFRSLHNLDSGRGNNFGGQPMVQALAAARRTVPSGWTAHSFSSHFLRAGAPDVPILYAVEPTRDGRRFASRRVLARQDGKPIFDMLCAFHDAEDGPAHQTVHMPQVPPPEALDNLATLTQRHADRLPRALVEVFGGSFPVELRLVDADASFFAATGAPERTFWFRMASAAGFDDPGDHQCLLAFMSDFWFASAAAGMHFAPGAGARVSLMTLNHSLWFHSPLRADDWLLYHTETPWAGDGRGLVRGLIYDRAGTLVASAVQEASMRTA